MEPVSVVGLLVSGLVRALINLLLVPIPVAALALIFRRRSQRLLTRRVP